MESGFNLEEGSAPFYLIRIGGHSYSVPHERIIRGAFAENIHRCR